MEFGIGLAGWFWLRISHEVAVSYQLGMQPSNSLTEVEEYTPKVHYSHGWQIGANCWHEASGLSLMFFLKCCLSVLITWQLASSLSGEGPQDAPSLSCPQVRTSGPLRTRWPPLSRRVVGGRSPGSWAAFLPANRFSRFPSRRASISTVTMWLWKACATSSASWLRRSARAPSVS